MGMRKILLLVLAGACAPHPARAQSDSLAVPYGLTNKSAYLEGCFGPCDCAVRVTPLRGTFILTDKGFDGLFENYAVTQVDWRAALASESRHLTGHGIYRVGGEFAITQELSLDLSIDDGPARRFESGIVPGGGVFPSIAITVSLHGGACVDTEIQVNASRLTAGEAVGPDPDRVRVWPNPFHGGADLVFSLPGPGPLEVVVQDVAGRTVRRLARETASPAGTRALHWDGRGDDGSAAPPGLYFVRLTAAGRTRSTAAVRLE